MRCFGFCLLGHITVGINRQDNLQSIGRTFRDANPTTGAFLIIYSGNTSVPFVDNRNRPLRTILLAKLTFNTSYFTNSFRSFPLQIACKQCTVFETGTTFKMRGQLSTHNPATGTNVIVNFGNCSAPSLIGRMDKLRTSA